MKEAEEIINRSKYWLNEDQQNRTAVVILANNKEDEIWAHAAGTSYAIARLIYLMMLKDKELGLSIYAVACLYAHNHIAAKARDKIKATIPAMREERKEPKGGE